jgi:AcrR family transcriptional regulator
VEINKQGQKLGVKGQRTRQKLIDAAHDLLRQSATINICAVAIAKAADVSAASFYIYFEDVRDLLFEMGRIAGQEFNQVNAILDEDWTSGQEVEHALRFVKTFNATWARHREVLHFRNTEADRGNTRFEALLMETFKPIVIRLGDKIRDSFPRELRPSLRDARAQASFLLAGMERNASSDPKMVERELGLQHLEQATAEVIARALYRRDRQG